NTRLPGDIGNATNRKVFRCVLHQTSKYRDFLTGMMPDVRPGQTPGAFRVVKGILYRASEFAKRQDSAALLIIDEINRGSAVQVFGGSIVAMESEKRLGSDGEPTVTTEFFDLLDPESGELIEYALPSQLYLLAAMNLADVSVEPLDVAFLRRWTPVNLEPSAEILREHFGLPKSSNADLPTTPSSEKDVFEIAVRAFEAINHRIALGRGQEFRIGHGVLMAEDELPSTTNGALEHLVTAWLLIKNHIDEAFFGNIRGTAVILNADRGITGNPYLLEETSFGDAPRTQIKGPVSVNKEEIYNLLRVLAITEV
ncbi:MAG: AAA family ATPase, partial [Gemmatimonadota bacterium]|nr:AAA family ATPase [Gemmatimonadota bacterium]